MSAHHPGSFRLSPIEGVPSKAFRCPACGRTFTRKDVMLRHQTRVTCRLNRLVRNDPQPPKKASRRASKQRRGGVRDREETAAGPVSTTIVADAQRPVSPPDTTLPNSPTRLSPSPTSAVPILPRSASMDHRSLPLPVHPAPYIPSRRESTPLPVLSPGTIDDTMRQFPQEYEERTWHPVVNYHPFSQPAAQQLVAVSPRGVHPAQQRWASRSPTVSQHSSPAFLEPFPVSVHPGVPSFPLVMG